MYFLEQFKGMYISILLSNFETPETAPDIEQEGTGTDITPLSPEDTLGRIEAFNRGFDEVMSTEEGRAGRLLELRTEDLVGADRDLAELSIDALQPGEDPNIGRDLDLQELALSRDALNFEIGVLQSQLESAGGDGVERELLEARIALYNNLLEGIQQVEQRQIEGEEGGEEEISWAQGNVIQNGTQFANRRGIDGGNGMHESEEKASDLFGYGNNTSSTAWCGGFVTRVCRESGYTVQTSHELRAKSFIECVDPRRERAHVFFMTADGRALGGNQSDRVQVQTIDAPIMGWVMPEDVGNPDRTYTREQNGPESVAVANIPAGAIVVTERGGNT